jgi:BlaI family transcriptional regulator, penicillinase repressor
MASVDWQPAGWNPFVRETVNHQMARTPQDVTDAELSVLQVLWELQTATVRELTERLYPEGTSALNATVQKLLERLEAKKCVKRNRKTWPHQFSAAIAREVLIARQLQTTADKLCQGEIHPLLTSLVKARGLTLEDRKSLRGLLDELDQAKK